MSLAYQLSLFFLEKIETEITEADIRREIGRVERSREAKQRDAAIAEAQLLAEEIPDSTAVKALISKEIEVQHLELRAQLAELKALLTANQPTHASTSGSEVPILSHSRVVQNPSDSL